MSTETTPDLIPKLQESVAGHLGLDPADVDPNRPINELGMDSLTAAQLSLDIEDKLGVSLFLSDLSGRETIAGLVTSLLRRQKP